MSVQSEIDRIITAVGNAYNKVSEKGGTLPSSQTVANLATAIDSIPAGGGGGGVEGVDISFIKAINNSTYDGIMILFCPVGAFECDFTSNNAYNFELSNSIPINEFFNEFSIIFGNFTDNQIVFDLNIINADIGQSGLLVKLKRR